MFLHRQFIDADHFPTVGVDAFPVDFVSASVLRFFPIHIAPKSLFLNEPCGQREHAVLSALEVPFVEDGEPVLKGHVGKTITVVVDALTEIKPVDSNHRLSTFAGVERGGDIGIYLPHVVPKTSVAMRGALVVCFVMMLIRPPTASEP